MGERGIQLDQKNQTILLAKHWNVKYSLRPALRHIARTIDPERPTHFIKASKWKALFETSQPSAFRVQACAKIYLCLNTMPGDSIDVIQTNWKKAREALLPVISGETRAPKHIQNDAKEAYKRISLAYNILRLTHLRLRLEEIINEATANDPASMIDYLHHKERYSELSATKKSRLTYLTNAKFVAATLLGTFFGSGAVVSLSYYNNRDAQNSATQNSIDNSSEQKTRPVKKTSIYEDEPNFSALPLQEPPCPLSIDAPLEHMQNNYRSISDKMESERKEEALLSLASYTLPKIARRKLPLDPEIAESASFDEQNNHEELDIDNWKKFFSQCFDFVNQEYPLFKLHPYPEWTPERKWLEDKKDKFSHLLNSQDLVTISTEESREELKATLARVDFLTEIESEAIELASQIKKGSITEEQLNKQVENFPETPQEEDLKRQLVYFKALLYSNAGEPVECLAQISEQYYALEMKDLSILTIGHAIEFKPGSLLPYVMLWRVSENLLPNPSGEDLDTLLSSLDGRGDPVRAIAGLARYYETIRDDEKALPIWENIGKLALEREPVDREYHGVYTEALLNIVRIRNLSISNREILFQYLSPLCSSNYQTDDPHIKPECYCQHMRLAKYLVELNKNEYAAAATTKALMINPDSNDDWAFCTELLDTLAKKDIEQSIELAKSLHEIYKEDERAIKLLGQLNARLRTERIKSSYQFQHSSNGNHKKTSQPGRPVYRRWRR